MTLKLKKLIRAVLLVAPCFFLLSFNTAHAVTISDGADAIGLIGQYQNLTDDPLVPDYSADVLNGGKTSSIGFSGIYGTDIDTVNKRLFVADANNNRVLIFNLNEDLTPTDKIADYVLGQQNFSLKEYGTNANSLYTPSGLAYASTTNYLYVVDSQNNRVLVYDVTTITNGEDAVYVLGQQDFTTRTTGTSISTMNGPSSVSIDQVTNRLFVGDSTNYRVLMFDVSSITNGEDAINVLGQPDFNTATFASTQFGMNAVAAVYYDYGRQYLFVGNASRLTIYDVATTTNYEPAIYVLGQTNFTNNSQSTQANRFVGGIGAITYDPVRQYLFVANSNRISIFDINIITTGESAINFLGVPTFGISSGDLGVSTSTVYFSYGLTYASSTLFASSLIYNRISIYDLTTISNGEGAVDVIGQYTSDDINNLIVNFFQSGPNNSGPNRYYFSSPRGIALDRVRHRMFVSDFGNNRILVFNLNNDNTIANFEADFVLGQPNFASSTASTTQTGLKSPYGIDYDEVGDRLFVSDYVNNRVVIYDTTTINNGEPAEYVLGQANFTSASSATSQVGMSLPIAIAYSTTTGMLYVGQSNTRRILVYNIGDGVTSGEAATYVLGQASFTLTQDSTIGASTTRGVIGLAVDNVNNRLFAADNSLSRIAIFDVSTIANGEDAIGVLGQSDFTTNTATTTQNGLFSTVDISYDESNNRLFVVDSSNRRVVVYNTATTTNGEKAINVLGQNNFETSSVGIGSAAITAASLNSAISVEYDSDNELLYVSQLSGAGNRISIFNAGPDTTAPALTAATTSTDGTSIYITYNEPLDENSLPTTTDFIISVNGAASSPTAVSISGATIILTTSSTIYSTDTLTLTYTAGTYPVTDYSGNLAPNISASALTNLSTQTVSTSTPDPEPTPSRRRSGGGRVVRTPTTAESTPSTPQQQSNTSQTLPPSTTRPTVFTRNLTSGTTGEDVRTLQRFLNSQGYTVATQGNGSNGQETTYFGRATEAALKQFQLANNITPTGTMGPLTQARIAELTANAPVQTPAVPSTSPATPSPSTTQSTSPYIRDLAIGSRGSDVTALQNFLIQQGYLESGFATGYFGQLTQAALIKFQQANNISPAVGYFGPKTRGVVGR